MEMYADILSMTTIIGVKIPFAPNIIVSFNPISVKGFSDKNKILPGIQFPEERS